MACRMSTSGGSEDAFHLTNGSLNFQGQSNVSGGEERRGCPPVAGPLMLLLTDMFEPKFDVNFRR